MSRISKLQEGRGHKTSRKTEGLSSVSATLNELADQLEFLKSEIMNPNNTDDFDASDAKRYIELIESISEPLRKGASQWSREMQGIDWTFNLDEVKQW